MSNSHRKHWPHRAAVIGGIAACALIAASGGSAFSASSLTFSDGPTARGPGPRAEPVLRLAQAGVPTEVVGYWQLEGSEFTTDASGALEWVGQIGIRGKVLEHDTAHQTIREIDPEGKWSVTSTARFHVPARLIPGEVAPFRLEVTCIDKTGTSPAQVHAQAAVVAEFEPQSYLSIGNGPCDVGRKIQAPALGWRIPSGKIGDTTTVKAESAAMSLKGAKQYFHYKWVGSPPPLATPDDQTAPTDAVPPAEAPRVPEPNPPLRPPSDPSGGSTWVPPTRDTGMELLPGVPEAQIVANGVGSGVTNGATRPTTFDLAGPCRITQLMTYHYGAGSRPGTIALRNDDGTLYGPWQAAGAVGQGGYANSYWWVRPNITVKPGRYTVIDSDPATWSTEAVTSGAGIIVVWGECR